jgi:GAF domain
MAERGDGGNGSGGQGQPSSSYTGQGSTEHLAQTLSDLARSLQDEDSLDDTLTGIVAAAVQTVPGSHYAGITLVQARRQVETRAPTDELVCKVDEAQYETGQGPCLDAAYTQRTVRLSDMTTEHRWPDFTRRALDLGIRSMLSFQLYVAQDSLGALNLYSDQAEAFIDESENVGLLFAAHAAVAMSGAQPRRPDPCVVDAGSDRPGQGHPDGNATGSPPTRRSPCWSAPASAPTPNSPTSRGTSPTPATYRDRAPARDDQRSRDH